ncbi:ankyrin repeat domain-containing protein SOWAHA-like [Arapaima gigas]
MVDFLPGNSRYSKECGAEPAERNVKVLLILCCLLEVENGAEGMSFTQEGVLMFLVERGGQVRSSDLVARFGGQLRSRDEERAAHLRATFKQFVDNVAVVKEIDGVKHVVVKKLYCHLLRQHEIESNSGAQTSGPSPARANSETQGEGGGSPRFGDAAEVALSCFKFLKDGKSSSAAEPPLERSRSVGNREEVAERVTLGSSESKWTPPLKGPSGTSAGVVQKPYMLPLRIPPPQAETKAPKSDLEEELSKKIPGQNFYTSPKGHRGEAEEVLQVHPPPTRKGSASVKSTDKRRYSGNVPLEATAHDWLVKTAVGHWGQVHGLLLLDTQLADKRDFMSGFTALHWAVKAGKTDMVSTIVEIAKRAGKQMDINCQSYGGYTPLHIAAIHDREEAITLLVKHYGADRNIRDNSGKKPCHYLHEHMSPEVRELLGAPHVLNREITPESSEVDQDTDIAKGFSTFSKLFQPYAAAHKKKPKRPEVHLISGNQDAD